MRGGRVEELRRSGVIAAALALGLTGCATHTPSPARDPGLVVTGPVAASDAGLYSELAIDGPLESRLSSAPADLILFYGGEQRGSMETCGCPHRPRGSLARVATYVTAGRAASPDTPALLLNAGEWLIEAVGFQNMPMPQLMVMDRTLAEGLITGGWDVLNVTPKDLAGLPGVAPADLARLPLVSANIEGPHIARSRSFTVGGRTIAVTGVAAPEALAADLPDYTIRPVDDALPAVQQIAAEVDGVVLLAYNSADSARMLAQRVPKVIAVIDAGGHNQAVEPFYVKNAVWVLSYTLTMRLGELRLTFGPEGRPTAIDRHIDLDAEIPDDPTLAAMQHRARVEIDATEM